MQTTITRNVVVDEIKKAILTTYQIMDFPASIPEVKPNETATAFSFDVLGVPVLINVILGSTTFRARMTIDGSIVNEIIDRYSRINSIIGGFTLGFDDKTKSALMKYGKKERITAYVVITGLGYLLKNVAFWLSRMYEFGVRKETMILDTSQVIDVDISEFHQTGNDAVDTITDGLKFIDYVIVTDPNPPEWLVKDGWLVKSAMKAEYLRLKSMMDKLGITKI